MIETNRFLENLQQVLSIVDSPRKFEILEDITNALNPATPTHEINLQDVQRVYFIAGELPERLQRGFHDELEPLVNQVVSELKARGHRRDTLTYQEHQILGSTQKEKYAQDPYKPIGIIKRDLTIIEAQRARRLAVKTGALAHYFNKEMSFIAVSLEPLDSQGNTVRDPVLLDRDLLVIPTTYAKDFPFRRKN